MKILLKRNDQEDINLLLLLNLPEDVKEKNSVVKILNKIDRGDSIFYDLEHTFESEMFKEMTLDQIERFVDYYEIDESLDENVKNTLQMILNLKEAFSIMHPDLMFDIELGRGAVRKNKEGNIVIFNIFNNIQKK